MNNKRVIIATAVMSIAMMGLFLEQHMYVRAACFCAVMTLWFNWRVRALIKQNMQKHKRAMRAVRRMNGSAVQSYSVPYGLRRR